MCGIAGYSLSGSSTVERTLAAQALLAGIAERGADAVGYAHRCPGGSVDIHKQRSGASALLEQVLLPDDATEVLVHVRDYTKGHPRIEANNHPIRHGAVVGVHNGIIFNDDDLMEQHGFERAEPQMTVDSEAIFVARGVGRPLWIGSGREELFFASTKAALEVVEKFLRLKLRKREIAEGTVVVAAEGRELSRKRFTPTGNFGGPPPPAVRAPHEGLSCLKQLAALAAL